MSAPRTTVEGNGGEVAGGSTEQRHYNLTVTPCLERSPVFDGERGGTHRALHFAVWG